MSHAVSTERRGIPDCTFGTVIGGDYMVVRPLGRGATGALFVVEQLSTSCHRALKVLCREYIADPTLFKRFEREAQMAARIPSEHVAQVIASGVDAKLQVPWIAMELLEGQTLGDHVEEAGPLDPQTVRQILEQLCHAIAAAHGVGIVHRDLKPANIFLSTARRVGAQKMVKVLDFGVARVIAENLTTTGSALGTPSWMSPEQTRGEGATTATDVWALGLVAFYMLTGHPFWRSSAKADDPMGVMAEISHSQIPAASARAIELGAAAHVPPGFDAWFALCVARAPEERFMNATAAYAALSQALRP